jgi:hypothetical protein
MTKATKRPCRIVSQPKAARITDRPPVDKVIREAVDRFCGSYRKTPAKDVEAVWKIAWDQRHVPLRSLTPDMRQLVILAREYANPTNGRPPLTLPNKRKYGSDEDSFAIFNG